MTKQQELEARLNAEFSPDFLHIENESHLHSSGRGSESHFKIVLVSDSFVGLSKVARHRLIYRLLAQDLQQGIHALALHTYSREEWAMRDERLPESTNCLGHGK
ncbi:BolA protein family transcriptional regulator [Mesocricetibacter intestinalis]|uniref:BolA protein family transcriptional regulator n=1 Tax=Mesocricetibacter intestinalis TaxID=1521930 RepID=A0A4R6V9G4_9PAST|nr:BolA/IbaG family iron-sulfur metabolism protein [Mesocricetibacter intestinalis]TDQ56225.1 BolA protein family transcriptional regulator [Mesocricetibacter intestinalis]